MFVEDEIIFLPEFTERSRNYIYIRKLNHLMDFLLCSRVLFTNTDARSEVSRAFNFGGKC